MVRKVLYIANLRTVSRVVIWRETTASTLLALEFGRNLVLDEFEFLNDYEVSTLVSGESRQDVPREFSRLFPRKTPDPSQGGGGFPQGVPGGRKQATFL